MPRVACCPKCGFLLANIPKSPSALRREAEAAASAERKHRRNVDVEVRRFYAADFKIIYDNISRTKMNQTKNGRAMSEVLFQSILKTHQKKLDILNQKIKEEVQKKLDEK